ncbi:RidA family protein [Streptomyces pilosus]|uniref:RidA family protein n=1 Tax=Streptomyces pilosus TaxID=28893 RepID=UPI00362500A5
MTHLTRLPAPDGVAPSARYSHVVAGTGRPVAVSGRPAPDEDGAPVGEGGPGAQARQVFEDMPAVRAARAGHMPGDRLPAASAVRVAGLVRPGFPLDVEARAVVAA